MPSTLATQAPNNSPNVPTLVPSISATLRAVQSLAREAQRHLRDARKAGDHKATNGAITAAAKALELVGKLRGELQHGQSTTVNVSIEAKQAIDSHAAAQALDAHDVTDQAHAWLAAQIESGDAYASQAVRKLMDALPSADASDATPSS